VALVALLTVAAAMVGVALKDTVMRFSAGLELGRMVKWETGSRRLNVKTA
jgi:hypothetical protein